MVEHLETLYGNSIVPKELAHLDDYLLVTNHDAWQLCKGYFQDHPPYDVIMIRTLDKAELDEIHQNISKGLEFVGLGGGTVLDATKYFAYLNNQVPFLIPSITSSNAPFTDFISIQKNGGPFGFKVDGYPKRIMIDYELIGLADKRLNRAGFGDLLYMQTTLNDWRIMQEKGVGPMVVEEIGEKILEMMDSTIGNVSEIGDVTDKGIKILMENTQLSAELYMDNVRMPISAGSEHLFAWNLERITGKPLIHGEIVSLGVVISSFLQSSFLPDSKYQTLRKALDDAKVIYHPDELGVLWEEIKTTLLTIEDYNRKIRHFHTVFELIEWDPGVFHRLKDYIYNQG
ncbi:iron-containing alcohol dehydrogenase [Bacillus sp. Marseille-Q3570]|uniref:iron-containing alcohol dehydrogenase n=1 Tax=Bacillus sp. Marseille-Q3570 TaxID=2963522 RepID=UPI0021B7CB5A|nr:iron-containing alcohol dehydrogenase [Bacillus sp. Marseille-Q3570]